MFVTYQNLFTLKTLIILIVIIITWSWKYIRRFYYVSKIPGPTAYPLIGNIHLLTGESKDISKRLLSIYYKFEPTLRFWLGLHPVVVISNPGDIETVLKSPYALDKPYLMTEKTRDLFGDSILISKGSKWKQHRKIVNSGMSVTILNSFIPLFVAESKILVKQLEKEVGNSKPFNVYEYCIRATLDAVTGAAVGVRMNSQQNHDNLFFKALNESLRILFVRGYNPLLFPDIIFKWTKLAKDLARHTTIIYTMTDKAIETKRKLLSNQLPQHLENSPFQKNSLHKPLLEYLLELEESNTMTHTEIRDETNIMILGGYETSAVTLSYVLLCLAANPKVQLKTYEEIQTVMQDGVINLEVIQKLRYMDMVIKETLRIFPTVPYIMRNVSEDIQLENYLLPKGCSCLIAIIGVHKNEKHWENPEEFIPERFLAENIVKQHPYSYIPFSAGPRNCVGTKYANIFIKILITSLLQEYEFHTTLKLNEVSFSMELTLKLVNGYLLNIRKRHHRNYS